MPDRMPNRMSEDMSDRMPEDLPVRKCINVMVGITRSKVIYGLSDALLCSNSKLSSPGSPFQLHWPSGHQPCIDSPYRRCFQLANDLQWGGGPPADCQRVHLQVYLQYDATQLFSGRL